MDESAETGLGVVRRVSKHPIRQIIQVDTVLMDVCRSIVSRPAVVPVTVLHQNLERAKKIEEKLW